LGQVEIRVGSSNNEKKEATIFKRRKELLAHRQNGLTANPVQPLSIRA